MKIKFNNELGVDFIDFDSPMTNFGDSRENDSSTALAWANNYGGYPDLIIPELFILIAMHKAGIGKSENSFWSSSGYVASSNYAWFVYFGYGVVNFNSRSSNYHVRLVRASQCMDICRLALEKNMVKL
jgi:hypothetical protein